MDLQLLNTGKSLKDSLKTVKKEANSIHKMEVLRIFSYFPSELFYFFKLVRLTAKKVWASG